MLETLKSLLALVVVVCFAICMFLYTGERLDTQGTKATFAVSVITGVAALCILLCVHLRRDKVPDFLRQMSKAVLERNGVCFSAQAGAIEGVAVLLLYYQNRYAGSAQVDVALRPSRGFFLIRNSLEPIGLSFTCGPAGFGVIQIPLPVPEKYQGTVQQFDIAADVRYPTGRGKLLRGRDGTPIGSARFEGLVAKAWALAGAATGQIIMTHPASFKVHLPSGVSEQDDPEHVPLIEELWTLGDPPRRVDDLFDLGDDVT